MASFEFCHFSLGFWLVYIYWQRPAAAPVHWCSTKMASHGRADGSNRHYMTIRDGPDARPAPNFALNKPHFIHAWRVVQATWRRLTALTAPSRLCTHMHAGRQGVYRIRTRCNRLAMARAFAPVLQLSLIHI